jgi:hypothetical protein
LPVDSTITPCSGNTGVAPPGPLPETTSVKILVELNIGITFIIKPKLKAGSVVLYKNRVVVPEGTALKLSGFITFA